MELESSSDFAVRKDDTRSYVLCEALRDESRFLKLALSEDLDFSNSN